MVHGEHQFIHNVSPTFLSAAVVVLFSWVFMWRGLRKSKKVSGKLYPSRLVASRMKFKLQPRAIRAVENPEEIECFQFDTSQIAVICFSHTSLTVLLLQNGL